MDAEGTTNTGKHTSHLPGAVAAAQPAGSHWPPWLCHLPPPFDMLEAPV
jgi:hypothetical protein